MGDVEARRTELRAALDRERSRLIDAAPGSPEWDAARTALDSLEWELTRIEDPDPDEESI